MAAGGNDTASMEEPRHDPPRPVDQPVTEQTTHVVASNTEAGDAASKDDDAPIASSQDESRQTNDGQRLPHDDKLDEQEKQQEQKQSHQHSHQGDSIPAINEKTDTSITAPKTVVLPRACTLSSTGTTLSNASCSLGLLPIPHSYDDAVPESIPPDRVTLVRADKKGDAYVSSGTKLKNDLYRAVGLLELANAGDFAANVWNKYPVPVYAIVFMAVGATFAGVMSVFAMLDARRAWRNVTFLRQQYRELRQARERRAAKARPTTDLDVLLSVVYREIGTEGINRWGLNLFMGAGAVLIAIGTYLALGGQNDAIFLASNLLSGYVGNSPIALFGAFNTCWAYYIFCKAQGHINAASKAIPGTRAMALIKRRSRNLQVYTSINGTATLVGGVGSMITATRWWGYVILIPVIMSAIFCNHWWRTRAGYTRRDLVPYGMSVMKVDELSTALDFAARAPKKIREHKKTPLNAFVSDPTSLQAVLTFIQEYELLEPFCERLVKNKDLRRVLGCAGAPDEIKIKITSLLDLPKDQHPTIIQVAQDTVRKVGPTHFQYRERYAAELLGTYFVVLKHEAKHRQKARVQSEKPGPR
ncbi:hypothetical protein HDV57DRAFT_265236 [Trichoderma longibrachiatum]|uniref:Integral membrane protein n=1 Tax=Trichoderma longibrachiatum ATCC 18648 TaxID=983965 RepID=A0A2T4BTT1_TRILO|nr:hypothetical protein M440DRAFT_1405149 [Trichoderma longibrachiatum ATCC 18648]